MGKTWGLAAYPLTFRSDIKPLNIFLDQSDPERYPDYSKPVLGDFGVAFKTPEGDPNNPRWYNTGIGTSGFKAPEHDRFVDRDSFLYMEEWQLRDWTNVYGFGVVLRCLVTMGRRPKQPLWVGDGEKDETLILNTLHPRPINRYIQRLIDLINDCLSFDPDVRPTSRATLDIVLRETDEGPTSHNRARGMRIGNADAATKAAQSTLDGADQYQIGIDRDQLA